NTSHDVLIIDKKNHHLFQPLLYQVATAALSPADISTPIRELFKKSNSTDIIMDEVDSIDLKDSSLIIKSKKKVYYENLIIATGARHSYFGNDSWETHATGLKTLDDALKIREDILKNFEASELEEDAEARKALTTFVVVGGGPTGVEMAGAIAEIAKKTLLKNFSNIDTKNAEIILIEGGNSILSSFDKSLSQKAKVDLEKLGVKVLLNTMVKEINQEGVSIGKDFIKTRNIIWAAGNEANPLTQQLKIELDRMKRVLVDNDCSIPEYPSVYVIGDAAAFKTSNGFLPGLAPVATQQGKYVANLIRKNIPKGKRDPFKYIDKGSMATIGKKKAIFQFKGIKLNGIIAWMLWLVVHLLFLVLFRNKVLIFISWVYSYITEKRSVRVIK
ncbi:NAD(P)/FAD-dependent oxidoreductase, partial [Bacteriovoracaceae bacterium]|nr:NAD(P)/FAD-dependent oxidoreductase [Bacteriovoracaceae bacterium]